MPLLHLLQKKRLPFGSPFEVLSVASVKVAIDSPETGSGLRHSKFADECSR